MRKINGREEATMKLFLIIVMVFCLTSTGMAAEKEKPKEKPKAQCPKTTMQESCLDCHIKGNFKVKETAPDAHLSYPSKNMQIIGWDSGRLKGSFLLGDIDADGIKNFFDYLEEKKIKDAIFEVHSPGGALFDAQRIVSMFEEWRMKGGTIETRCLGISASAAFFIFVSGDKGKRFVSPYSDLMWHEIRTVEGWAPRLAMPSSKEDEAKVFRHLQDIRNEYLATRGKLSKEELDRMIRYKDWWMSGKQAFEYGFADGFIGRQP